MLPLHVPAQATPAPAPPVDLGEALARLLDDYDQLGEGAALSTLAVRPADRAVLDWLRSALTEPVPANPFPKGGRAHREAEALRALLADPGPVPAARIAALDLEQVGTQMALWRWARREARAGRLDRPRRQALEDALLAVPVPTLATGYALRHALSHALAEADAARFSALKAAHGATAPMEVLAFQRLFSLIGTPGPLLRLWTLPARQVVTVALKDLGGSRVWLCPRDPGPLVLPPASVAWIIPAGAGATVDASPIREEAVALEAERLALEVPAPGAAVWLAPEREDLEVWGLSVFPVLIRLDAAGLIAGIEMGEAAPAKP